MNRTRIFVIQAVESLRSLAGEYTSASMENHFVPLVKRLATGEVTKEIVSSM